MTFMPSQNPFQGKKPRNCEEGNSLPFLFRQVNVFFQDHNAEVITEVEQFESFFNFLNTLGGAMALWLGITIVGAFEIIEWVARYAH